MAARASTHCEAYGRSASDLTETSLAYLGYEFIPDVSDIAAS